MVFARSPWASLLPTNRHSDSSNVRLMLQDSSYRQRLLVSQSLLFGAWLCIVAFSIWSHAFWRDEIRPLSVALQAPSLFTVPDNTSRRGSSCALVSAAPWRTQPLWHERGLTGNERDGGGNRRRAHGLAVTFSPVVDGAVRLFRIPDVRVFGHGAERGIGDANHFRRGQQDGGAAESLYDHRRIAVPARAGGGSHRSPCPVLSADSLTKLLGRFRQRSAPLCTMRCNRNPRPIGGARTVYPVTPRSIYMHELAQQFVEPTTLLRRLALAILDPGHYFLELIPTPMLWWRGASVLVTLLLYTATLGLLSRPLLWICAIASLWIMAGFSRASLSGQLSARRNLVDVLYFPLLDTAQAKAMLSR